MVVRKSGDYVTKMLELAGGRYVFDNLGDPETRTSTVVMEMERFLPRQKTRIILFITAPSAVK